MAPAPMGRKSGAVTSLVVMALLAVPGTAFLAPVAGGRRVDTARRVMQNENQQGRELSDSERLRLYNFDDAAERLRGGNVAMERSFIMVKPDGVQRGLVHEVIGRFERRGFKLAAMKVMLASEDLLGEHYAEHKGKKFYHSLVNYMSSGPVVAMVWEGKDVVTIARKMLGATNPLESDPGTIRGDLGIEKSRNVCHGSDSVDSAKREISLWFGKDEIIDYYRIDEEWVYDEDD